MLSVLVGFPLLISLLLLFVRQHKAFVVIIRGAAAAMILFSILFSVSFFAQPVFMDLSAYTWLHPSMLAIELLLAAYIIYIGLRNKQLLVALFSFLQACGVIGLSIVNHGQEAVKSLYIDRLSILMVIIVGVIGSLICVYAVEYMKDYHHHHPEYQDRRSMFFSVLFLFMSAMMGLVLCNDLQMLLFCWEITSFCSFMLIGYTRLPEAVANSFRALTINVGGGLSFTLGLLLLAAFHGVTDLDGLLHLNLGGPSAIVELAVLLMAIAGLTKSAQMPFSGWLLGAMVAPTPTSAMLHSSTMVKAGVYLIIRLAPLLGHSPAGISITLIGGVTFFFAAVMAVSQSDAKKVLAYSTISNLGLIVACAGIDTAESLWAAIMLIVFHAIAKSLLFLAVGSTEHQLNSRDVEDMDGLYHISTTLTMLLIIGIAGMFVAPFGMLISKWAAMKAFIDSKNIILILLVAFGSTVTLFFWTKWMGKLIANANRKKPTSYIMRIDEKLALYPLAALVIVVCALHPVISNTIVIPYINSNLLIHFVSPIGQLDTTIIILMMCILFVLPLFLVPLYRSYRVKDTSVYMAGENTGTDNESYYGSMGQVQHIEMRNWYLSDMFGPERWSEFSGWMSGFILLAGICWSIGGFFL